MTQPTDPRRSSRSGAQASPADPSAKATPRQDTILLSEVPDSQTLIAEPADWGTGGNATLANTTLLSPTPTLTAASTTSNVELSTAALAALGQRYDVLSNAGHGSMGNVFKARDRETSQIVALKLLKPEIASDQAMMDRFKNELLFARKITHKNVCRVYDFNRIGGVAYTSMEFVEGESLRSVLNRFGGLPVRKAIDLALQICSGLKEAHAQGIVHRDLKPENIMVDDRGNVKIMDFGIARSMDTLTRMTGAMVGTPAYMAPEQVGGKAVDYRTDIYSLGLILYEMFTGAQAFHAENAVAIAMKQLQETPVPPHEVDPGIPAAIERTILKCLEKEPARRFQSVEELEKAFAPSSAQTAASAAASTTAGRSTQEALGNYSTAAPSLRGVPPAPAATRSGSRKWMAIAAVLLCAFVAAAGAGRWAKRARLAAAVSPPAAVTPAPPDFALAASAATGANASAGASSAAPAKASLGENTAAPSATTAAPVAPTDTTSQASVAVATPAPAASASAPLATAVPAATTAAALAPKSPAAATGSAPASPADVQQRADAAFKEPSAASAAQQSPAPGSVLRGSGPSYIWVGRFEREDRAQDASRKIQGLGMPSVVIPRRTLTGQVFVVFTGPVAAQKIPSEIDWLKTQGFPNVREVKGLGLGEKSNPAAGGDNTDLPPSQNVSAP